MSTPLVPPRPSRTSQTTKDSLPEVPPRPFRKMDPSPSREMRSPLNELPNPMGSMGKKRSQTQLLTPEVPPRPSIQTIPSIGQEGSEYASFDQLPAEAHGVETTKVDAPEQTRNVSANMPLHAPKASVPQSTAKSKIATVTGTDSTQAAAMGIGKAKPADDVHKLAPDSSNGLTRVTSKPDEITRVQTEPGLKTKSSFNRSTPSLHATSRPGSMYNEGFHEQGIPEIGMQIPLYPNAGDVQAPSPAPTQSQFTPGIGFFNDGSARAHKRRTSSRQEFGPPGSYGLHSHGQDPQDQFEREWIAKNPDRAAVEGYTAFGTPRPATALTSAELNKLVNQNNDVGMATDPNMVSTPGADVAWGATEEYLARYASPKPSPLPMSEGPKRRSSSGGQHAAQSPLRKTSFPFQQRRVSNDAVENDVGVIHVDSSERKPNKITGGGDVDGALDLGSRGGNTEERGGWFDEQGYGTPILASDEIIKRPGSAFMQPAVDPETHDEYESDHYESSHGNSRRNSLRVPSRPSSRPNSMHGEYSGGNLYRFMSHDEHHGSGVHTPLEEIEEYEPLIPEGQEESPKPKPKARKRPGLENHHFPSQDIWEDTPLSLQYSTTVDTPESPLETRAVPTPATTTAKPTAFETPEQEQQRKDQNPNDMFSDNKTLMKPHVRDEMRPGMHRFPSQDVWEDTPSSMYGVTTVSGPQMEEETSPPEDRPTTAGQDEGDARATTGFTQNRRPSVPARPLRKSKLAEEIKPEDETESTSRDISSTTAEQPPSPDKSKRPAIPDRPKPSVPPRPAKKTSGEAQADGLELSKSISPEDTSSVPKAKPAVPARPAGEKIAALKAGFMNDLNNRLKLGPTAPPTGTKEIEPEPAEETTKAPLADARKGRAKGPARRKPAASPSAGAEEKSGASFSICSMVTLWEIDESDAVQVPSAEVAEPAAETTEAPADGKVELPELAKEMAANEAHNTAEPTLGEPMSPERAEAILSPPPELSTEEPGKADAVQVEAGEPHGEMKSPVPDLGPSVLDVEEKETAPATTDADATVAATDHAATQEVEPTVTVKEVS